MKRRGSSRILTPDQYAALLEQVFDRDQGCWFVDHVPHVCLGEADAVHLIPQANLRDEFRHGAIEVVSECWLPQHRVEIRAGRRRSLADLAMDDRNVVCGCRWIHKIFDARRFAGEQFEFPRTLLPERFEEFAFELGLEARAARRFPIAVPADGWNAAVAFDTDPNTEFHQLS